MGVQPKVLQMQDCIDVLRLCFGDIYDFYFLFDHTSDHAKQRIDGLDADEMNKSSLWCTKTNGEYNNKI